MHFFLFPIHPVKMSYTLKITILKRKVSLKIYTYIVDPLIYTPYGRDDYNPAIY